MPKKKRASKPGPVEERLAITGEPSAALQKLFKPKPKNPPEPPKRRRSGKPSKEK